MNSLSDYRQAANTLFPIRGQWSYDAWQAINSRFWDDSLNVGPILWGLTAGCNFGSYNPNNNAITLHEALPGRDFAKQGEVDWVMANRDQALASWGLQPDAFGIGTALGTLLHETMHQAHIQQGIRYGDEPHHNEVWIAECDRVASLIGLEPRIFPLYRKRKEHAEEVRSRMQAAHDADPRQPRPDDFTGKQLNNRRRWIWVPTLDGVEVKPTVDDDGVQWLNGDRLASDNEITMFPRESYTLAGVKPADRVGLILPS